MTKHTTQMLSNVVGLPFVENEPKEIKNTVDYNDFLTHGHTALDVERGFSPLKMQHSLEYMKYLCVSSLVNLLRKEYNTRPLSTAEAIDYLENVPVEQWLSTLVNKLK